MARGGGLRKFHRLQKKLLLAHLGKIDPESIEEYMRPWEGMRPLERPWPWNRAEIISMIKESGLRGRGGGGFPTGLNGKAVEMPRERVKYVLCNADEGDPGAFMDRSIIEGNAHAVIEGMIIGAYAIGASEGYVYIRAEYPLAVDRLHLALDAARERGISASQFSARI
jgi:NADH:ubiquinone oxidoreductase subunit F (NADH-binding)